MIAEAEFEFLTGQRRVIFEPPPKISVAEWCARHLTIPPPQTQSPGPFFIAGREFCREPLDDFADPAIHDEVLCFGSQSGKTTVLMGGVAYMLANLPTAILWFLPNIDLARSFSETRWTPVVNASDTLARMKPVGRDRHGFKNLQQIIGASILNFSGSNSPANLASRPAQVVILDEVDKFNEGGQKEADAVNLAEQRTKAFASPKRVKTSTPTLTDGLIWQEFLKGDQRRYFVPCPHCAKHVVLCWSPEMTIFTKLGCEAHVRWDGQSKRANGTWDMDRVHRSARAECPHCGFHILDAHKTRMNREGEWRPTASAPKHFRSRHLPSLYAVSPETSFGKLAVNFLQAKQSLMGLQGFINGSLAEPFESQDTRGQRIEIIVRDTPAERPAASKILTADFQVNAPHLWYVVREWGDGYCEGLEAGPLMEWDQLREVQERHGIPNNFVGVDSGDQTLVVYEQAVKHGILTRSASRIEKRQPPLNVGWIPFKGMSREGWRSQSTGAESKVRLSTVDHLIGGRMISVPVLHMVDHHMKNFLDLLRKGKLAGFEWRVRAEAATEEYWRHMDGEIYLRERNPKTGRWDERWKPRSKTWPNHILDCEKGNIGMAIFHKLLKDVQPAAK
jgi:hypothetical protein